MESGTPLVSVCITTYNLEKQIEETLDSILAQQTTFSFEIIVHDDASSDSTPGILKRYERDFPGKIKTILQKKNLYRSHPGGMGHIFNSHLLPETSGRYIAICDGDDYWTTNDKLESQYRCMKRNPTLSGCFTNVKVINEMTGETTLYYNSLDEGIVNGVDVILKGGSIASASTLFFCKERFKTSAFYEQYEVFSQHHEYDTLFVYCLIFAGPLYYIDEVTAIYRRWEQGLYSGILNEPLAISKIKEKEMLGNLKLLSIVPNHLQKALKRKISVDSLFILRHGTSLKRYKYLKNLTFKELFKWLTNI